MFGYVKPFTSELKVKEQTAYQGIYCGLCKIMGKCTGNCSRLSLNYDFVFLAAVRAALQNKDFTYKKHRCIVHPCTKKAAAVENDALEYAAAASAILVYEKLYDDKKDEKGLKLLRSLILLPFAKHAKKKAKLPELEKAVRLKLSELDRIEKAKTDSVDIPAEKFGELLAEIFSYGLEGNEKRIAYSIGLSTGKWIYATDAADDMEDDLKKQNYNPYLLLWENNVELARSEIPASLRLLLNDLSAAIELIDFKEIPILEGIIKNIIYIGMPYVHDKAVSVDKEN